MGMVEEEEIRIVYDSPNMSEEKSPLENRDPRSIEMPYHPEHPLRLHHS